MKRRPTRGAKTSTPKRGRSATKRLAEHRVQVESTRRQRGKISSCRIPGSIARVQEVALAGEVSRGSYHGMVQGVKLDKHGSKSEDNKHIIWLTQEMLAGPQYLNSDNHAEVVCGSVVLPRRSHMFKPLADAGVVEHEWQVRWNHFADFCEEQTMVTAEGSLTADNYTKIRDQLASQAGTTRSPAATRQRTKDLTPRRRQAKAQQESLREALKDVQTVVLKVGAALKPAALDPLVKKLEQRSWGESCCAGAH